MACEDTENLGAMEQPMTEFHHPYTPYSVQLDFMRTAYSVLSRGEGQVGILESPTGTGKSLSLICSALTWLRTFKKQQAEGALATLKEKMRDEPDWMVEQMLKRKREELTRAWREREERLEKVRVREREAEKRGVKRRRVEEGSGKRREIDEEEEFLVGEWRGEEEDDRMAGLSKGTRALMESMGLGGKVEGEEDEGEDEEEIKIYYTSRTHSQLSQFIAELRRPAFPSSVPDLEDDPGGGAGATTEAVKHVPLSSRQRLCINPAVNRLGSLSAINDRCTELQQSKSKDKKCPFLPDRENLSATHRFRDAALATVPDIEDMFQLGKEMRVCPYYASRTALRGAEIVSLPYPLLLQQSAREALGIKLEGNVVVIDEAHNIMDAVSSVYAAEIRLGDLRRARGLLGVYVRRFGKKLKGENRIMVAQVARVVDALTEWMDGALAGRGAEQGIVDPNLLLKAKGADQLNLFQLITYVQESKLAFKVESYASHVEAEGSSEKTTAAPKTVSSPVLHTLVSFLTSLTNLSSEGRIFFERIPGATPDIKLSYLLLSPTHAFSSIAKSARAVILAGGTMSPFDDYKAHLFPALPSEKITTLSCGHVIPPENLCVWTLVSTKPTKPGVVGSDSFEFSFQRRGDKGMIRQLGMALLNICTIVPDGVVVFFPSYGYLDQVVAAWQSSLTESGRGTSMWERLVGKKAIFRDGKGADSEEVLKEYTAAILDDHSAAPGKTSRGALLLSVVGGRMSEGINFSDRLGRCVVVVGLPYPNINSPEWKARIEYIESSTVGRLASTEKGKEEAVREAKMTAREYYENACMRAVNQSIGRAIRHKGDYAAIVLVDRRFGTERIRGKLPGWIKGGMRERCEEGGLHGLMGALGGFFGGRRL